MRKFLGHDSSQLTIKGDFKSSGGGHVFRQECFINPLDTTAFVEATDKRVILRGDLLGLNKIYYSLDGTHITVSNRFRDFYKKPIDKHLEPLQRQAGFIPYPFTVLEGVRKAFPGVETRLIQDPVISGTCATQYDPTSLSSFFEGITRHPDFKQGFLDRIAELKILVQGKNLVVSLSGGFDSLLLAHLFRDNLTGVVHYEDDPERAGRLKNHLKGFLPDLPWCVVTSDDVTDEDVDLYFRSTDEPCCDVLGFAEFLMIRKLRERQGANGPLCVLSGEGADSIFGHGREYFKEHWLGKIFGGRGGLSLHKLIWYHSFVGKILDYLKSTRTRFFDDYTEHFSFSKNYKQEVFEGYRLYDRSVRLDRANFYGLLELLLFCSNQASDKLKTSATLGVDFFLPFYDHEILKLGFSIPSSEKVGYSGGKRILKQWFPEIDANLYHSGAPWSVRLWRKVFGTEREDEYMEKYYQRWLSQKCH